MYVDRAARVRASWSRRVLVCVQSLVSSACRLTHSAKIPTTVSSVANASRTGAAIMAPLPATASGLGDSLIGYGRYRGTASAASHHGWVRPAGRLAARPGGPAVRRKALVPE